MSAKIAGNGWSAQADEKSLLWNLDGHGGQALAALRMLSDRFNADSLQRHLQSTMEYGREFGMLYPLAAEFLNAWGIKCEVVGLPPIQFEAPLPG